MKTTLEMLVGVPPHPTVDSAALPTVELKHATDLATVKLIHNIMKEPDKGQLPPCILLDLSKPLVQAILVVLLLVAIEA